MRHYERDELSAVRQCKGSVHPYGVKHSCHHTTAVEALCVSAEKVQSNEKTYDARLLVKTGLNKDEVPDAFMLNTNHVLVQHSQFDSFLSFPEFPSVHLLVPACYLAIN
jgi:hypothetical protein